MISLSWLAVLVFGLGGCQPTVQASLAEILPAEVAETNIVEVSKAEVAETNAVKVPTAGLAEAEVVEAVCELIYQGEFDAAGELIEYQLSLGSGLIDAEQLGQERQGRISQLAEIVEKYREINRRRQSAREAVYAEKLAELEKLREAAEATKKVSEVRVESDINDVNDGGLVQSEVNDVNGVWKVLSVIAKACEFANDGQREELLSEPFVKQSIAKAKKRAAELEQSGKWLEAYTNCYWWLSERIYPDNEEIKDYAKQLMEKAGIVASFSDSPCETRQERYENVKEEMFVRAVNVLNSNYVNIFIDYRQMASEAIKRCRLLVDVLERSELELKGLEPIRDPNERRSWLSALASILAEIEQSPMGVSKDKFIDVFKKVLAENDRTVGLPRGILITQFAEAALSVLDNYTVIVWPKQTQDFEKMMTNEFTGIGIEITKEKGLLTVASLLPDTPAYNSGLDAGDVIEKVDDVETKDMSLGCAVKRITGPAGTEVKLTVRRGDEEQRRDITIIRAKIVVGTIRGWKRDETGVWLYMIDPENRIGYVRITNFSQTTASDLAKVLESMERVGLNGLVLDLRGNTGGLLEAAAAVADAFLEEGLIVSTRPRWRAPTYTVARKNGTVPNWPLVVLIDAGSASASEIVAGALADRVHKRAILVGERTHGKGSVQGITGFPGAGAQLKYTMAYYHLPSGERVESATEMKKVGRSDWGVGPNVEVKLTSEEKRSMFNVQRGNSVLFKADHHRPAALLRKAKQGGEVTEGEKEALTKHTAEETISSDPQLAVGLLVVRTKLIQQSMAESGAWSVERDIRWAR